MTSLSYDLSYEVDDGDRYEEPALLVDDGLMA